jgi:hypothetical protein
MVTPTGLATLPTITSNVTWSQGVTTEGTRALIWIAGAFTCTLQVPIAPVCPHANVANMPASKGADRFMRLRTSLDQ